MRPVRVDVLSGREPIPMVELHLNRRRPVDEVIARGATDPAEAILERAEVAEVLALGLGPERDVVGIEGALGDDGLIL